MGASLLPRTDGFSNLTWTALCLGAYVVSLWAIAVLIRQGVALSIIVPLMAAAVPLLTIGVVYFFFGQTFTIPKLALLVAACLAIGVAGSMN